ncbi:MAG: hypothetical protein V3S10_05160 [Dehalococcoidales bacterium]
MARTVNLASRIRDGLPVELVDFMAAAVAACQGHHVYLVGGVVRDLLLGRENLDLDIVVEGDATGLARQLASSTGAKLTSHPQFGTAKLSWRKWSVDFAAARSETYSSPGALPTVADGTLTDDLARRDFTINAMAVRLNPDSFGDLVDEHDGRRDLERRLIRVLHKESFVDDATRIWRGLRYEQRLGFRLERTTEKLVARDIPMLGTVSGDRIRNELELALAEREPEKVLVRADQLKVLPALHPALRADPWLVDRFAEARAVSDGVPPPGLYLALLTYPLTGEEVEDVIGRLRLPRPMARMLRDSHRLKMALRKLGTTTLVPSDVHEMLSGYSPAVITAAQLVASLPMAQRWLRVYQDELRHVRTELTGDDLMKMGVPAGKPVGEVLGQLLADRLDGQVASRKDEEAIVSRWLEDAGRGGDDATSS